MVQINFAQKEIQCKIVYYGPGMSGKTTNLELVHGKVPGDARGELTSIATTGERTLYFDYMPLDLGQIAGIRTKFQLYTVPGQIYYKSTRRLVLQGVDGIVFVADSSAAKLKENQESFADLEENLSEMGKGLNDVPIIVQYNKRDLPDAMSIEQLEKEVNPHGFPHFPAVATKGDGVFPTLKSLAGMVLEMVNKGGLSGAKPRAAPAPAKAAAPKATASANAAPAAAAAPAAPPRKKKSQLRQPVAAGATAAAPSMQAGAPAAARSSMPAQAPRAPSGGGGGGGGGYRGSPPRNQPPMPQPPVVQHVGEGNGAPRQRAPRAAPVSGADRDFADRVVKVHGLSGRSSSAKLPIILVLLALIGGAVVFAVSKFL